MELWRERAFVFTNDRWDLLGDRSLVKLSTLGNRFIKNKKNTRLSASCVSDFYKVTSGWIILTNDLSNVHYLYINASLNWLYRSLQRTRAGHLHALEALSVLGIRLDTSACNRCPHYLHPHYLHQCGTPPPPMQHGGCGNAPVILPTDSITPPPDETTVGLTTADFTTTVSDTSEECVKGAILY